jgi:hypothetical protein
MKKTNQMSLPGALSDEAIKKKCSPFFVSNLKVAELADPKPPFKENEFLNGLVNPPRHPSRRPTRPYDDISNFLSLSGGTTLIQKAVDEYADEVKTIYKKHGGAKQGSSASVQLPLMHAPPSAPVKPDVYRGDLSPPSAPVKPEMYSGSYASQPEYGLYDDDNDFGERPSRALAIAALLGGVGAIGYYAKTEFNKMRQANLFRELVERSDHFPFDDRLTPLARGMLEIYKDRQLTGAFSPELLRELRRQTPENIAEKATARRIARSFAYTDALSGDSAYERGIAANRVDDMSDLERSYKDVLSATGQDNYDDLYTFEPNEYPFGMA